MPIFRAWGRAVCAAVSPPRLSVADRIGQFKTNFPQIFLNDNAALVLNKMGSIDNLRELNRLLLKNKPLTSENLRPKVRTLRKIKGLAETLDTKAGVSFNVIFFDGFLKLAEAKSIAEIESFGRLEKVLDELGIPYYTLRNTATDPYRKSTPPHGINIERIDPFPAQIEGVEINIIRIKSGKFKMGDQSSGMEDEKPVREITISKDFGLAEYDLTNKQFKPAVEGDLYSNPEYWKYEDFDFWHIKEEKGWSAPDNWEECKNKDDYPVTGVSWYEAVAFCNWLSKKTGRRFRLPTEAEWEYVVRGGDGRKYPWGNEKYDPRNPQATFNVDRIESVKAHDDISHPFRVKNLTGNVWKWILDWYGNYKSEEVVDPKGPKEGRAKVLRGGSGFILASDHLRCALRFDFHPEVQGRNNGFRPAEDLL